MAGTTVDWGQERGWEWRSHFPKVTHSAGGEEAYVSKKIKTRDLSEHGQIPPLIHLSQSFRLVNIPARSAENYTQKVPLNSRGERSNQTEQRSLGSRRQVLWTRWHHLGYSDSRKLEQKFSEKCWSCIIEDITMSADVMIVGEKKNTNVNRKVSHWPDLPQYWWAMADLLTNGAMSLRNSLSPWRTDRDGRPEHKVTITPNSQTPSLAVGIQTHPVTPTPPRLALLPAVEAAVMIVCERWRRDLWQSR